VPGVAVVPGMVAVATGVGDVLLGLVAARVVAAVTVVTPACLAGLVGGSMARVRHPIVVVHVVTSLPLERIRSRFCGATDRYRRVMRSGQPRGERFAGLVDAEERHRAHPTSFSIPRSDLRHALAAGDRVKLLFGVGDGSSTERMWVEVIDVVDGRYIGRLDNQPVAIVDLRAGDRVEFGPEHVAAIWRQVPDAPTDGQFAIVSSRVARDGLPPVRAVRMTPPDPSSSGWLVFAAGDPPMPDERLSGFEPVTHFELLKRHRSFDSIEDEPPGTEWRWDEPALEWRGGPGAV
jgi:uncharacterized protein YegJ (DUF2314 family)